MRGYEKSVVVLLALSACSKVKSGDLRTQGMSAVFEARGLETGAVETTATLRQGERDTLTFVELSGEDQLVTKVGATEKTMQKRDFLNIVSYEATFNGENVENAQFTFAFTRTGDGSAPSSTCTLPKNFSIVAPTDEPDPQQFKRSLEDVVVAYDNASTTYFMRYKITGSCIQDKELPLDDGDLGTFTIPKTMFVPTNDDRKNDPCDVTIRVIRFHPGNIDSAFGKGGKIECMQERTVKIRSVP